MFNRFRSFLKERQARRLIRRHIAALGELKNEEDAEVERLQGKWYCAACGWEGDGPDPDSITWELEDVRGMSPSLMEQVADCPQCGTHQARLGGDPGRPIPEDYPLPAYGSAGTCPACGSEKTVPIQYGYPNNRTMLAASRGRVRLGGCVVMSGPDGLASPTSGCNACGHRW